MKKVIFYKAVSGFYIASFCVKGQRSIRKQPIGNTIDCLSKAVKRYSKKGYVTYYHDGYITERIYDELTNKLIIKIQP